MINGFDFKAMGEREAWEVAWWEYPPPYDFYNMKGSPEAVNEMLVFDFFSVYKEEDLVGYFCFGEPARVPGGRKRGLYNDNRFLDIGLGLRPELTGKGTGLQYLLAGLEFATKGGGGTVLLPPFTGFRLSVVTFNHRAIKVYKKAGFQIENVFVSLTPAGVKQFYLMIRDKK